MESELSLPGKPPKAVNRQLWENSPLRAIYREEDSPVAEGDRLFNERPPNLAILHEKPEHRLLLWMKAQGASNREIARQSGYTEPWLSQLFRQPWAKDRLVQIMTDEGKDLVQGLLQSACADSIYKLMELRDGAESEQVQRSAADSLLDRWLGKPRQTIEATTAQVNLNLEDVEALDKQLAMLESEEKQLKGLD